jgi:nucleoid-associated protein YgaU
MASANATQSSTKVNSVFKWGDSYGSLLLGILVVFIAAFFFVFLTQFRKAQPVTHPKLRQEVTSTKTVRLPGKPAVPNTAQNTSNSTTYTVQPGDDLWSIAIKEYNDGYKWTQIAKANNLTNPGLLYKGQALSIPQAFAQAPQTVALPTAIVHKTLPTMKIAQNTTPAPPATAPVTQGTITGDSYAVQHGDNLWSIAVRAYNDGYKWPQIAKANSLANPGVIHSGNVLKIPRG